MGRRRVFLVTGLFCLAAIIFYAALFRNNPLKGVPTPYEAQSMAVMVFPEVEAEDLLYRLLLKGEKAEFNHFRTEGDVAPEPGQEVIIGVTLSKDRGTLGIFSVAGDQPRLLEQLSTLPLQGLQVIELEPGRQGILVRELLDESFGAYFCTSFYTLYLYQDGGYQEVWRKVVSNEERWPKKWLGQGEGWQGIKDEVEIDFVRDKGRLVIKTREKRIVWEGPEPGAAPLTGRERFLARVYCWEPRWCAIILAEGEVQEETVLYLRQGARYIPQEKLAVGEKLAVLEEEEVWGGDSTPAGAYYRVKTTRGQVGFVGKKALKFLR